MGKNISRSLNLTTNEFCLKFVGKEALSQNDPFWNTFLAFNIIPPLSVADQLALESQIEPLCQELLKNNLDSGNLGVLIQVFLIKCTELLSATNDDANLYNWQFFNTIFTIRCALKFLTEVTTEDQLMKHIEHNGNGNACESFIGALVGIIVDVPVNDSTYLIHLEAVTCLIIMLSVQYHSGCRSEQSSIYKLIMKGKHVIHAPLLVRSLLTNFINLKKIPPGYGATQGYSLVLGLASDLWSMLTFTKNYNETILNERNDFHETPLAIQSLLLILVLVHHWTTQSNPYRNSLFSCLDSQVHDPIPPTQTSSLFKIDFNLLYISLCKKASTDLATLLLYLLLHRNTAFKLFLLQRTDLDQLLDKNTAFTLIEDLSEFIHDTNSCSIMEFIDEPTRRDTVPFHLQIIPILKILYNAPNSNSHHIYMSLIILLILSEEETFNKSVHDVKLKTITWYTERALTEISLGSLLILVVIRTIQYNMLKMRDKYLHTNCLAALANMSSQFRDLHPYVSQRLISLYETLAKKYQKLVEKMKAENNDQRTDVTIAINESDMGRDLSVLEEVLRIVLEILNSCLSTQLPNNPNLIYTLLYNKHSFEILKENVVFQDIIHNINIIMKYFSQLLQEKSQMHEVDAHQVLQVIREGAKSWPKDKLTKFPDLKFKYVEEDQPEDFFIPYVWALVNQQSVMNWSNDTSTILSSVC